MPNRQSATAQTWSGRGSEVDLGHDVEHERLTALLAGANVRRVGRGTLFRIAVSVLVIVVVWLLVVLELRNAMSS
jgi:hypothetical protein